MTHGIETDQSGIGVDSDRDCPVCNEPFEERILDEEIHAGRAERPNTDDDDVCFSPSRETYFLHSGCGGSDEGYHELEYEPDVPHVECDSCGYETHERPLASCPRCEPGVLYV